MGRWADGRMEVFDAHPPCQEAQSLSPSCPPAVCRVSPYAPLHYLDISPIVRFRLP